MAAIAQRVLGSALVLFGACTLTFLLIHLVPGDPVDSLLGPQAAAEDRERLREVLGLNQPITDQYFHFLGGLARGDLGTSFASRSPVAAEIADRMPATFELALAAIVVALLIGIPLGVLSSTRYRSWWDRAALGASLVGVSIPTFFLGPLLILIFAIHLGWFPVSERSGLASLILPSVTLGLALSGILMRMTRASMLECLREDYIRTARAKGVAPARIHYVHALKNALMPIITIVGLQIGSLLTGAVVTETVFDWPGLGSLFFQAIQKRDYPMVQGCVLVIACLYVLASLVTDLAYQWANPRSRGEP